MIRSISGLLLDNIILMVHAGMVSRCEISSFTCQIWSGSRDLHDLEELDEVGLELRNLGKKDFCSNHQDASGSVHGQTFSRSLT